MSAGETRGREVVTIDLSRHPSHLPLGMLLAPGAGGRSGTASSPGTGHGAGDTFGHLFSGPAPPPSSSSSPTSSNVTLVAGWEHDDAHGGGRRRLGPIQRSGLVRLGDRLVRINGRDVTEWTFREVMDALRELVASPSVPAAADRAVGTTTRKMRLRTLGFAPAGTAEWARGTHHPTAALSESMFLRLFNTFQPPASGEGPPARAIHSKRTYSFVSFVGRWRVAYESTGDAKSEKSKGDAQEPQQQRQHSENSRQHSESSNELERQLNKEPSINYGDDHQIDLNAPTSPPRPSKLIDGEGDSTAPSPPSSPQKPFIQYEIQCHILFKDPSSFGNPANVHRSWSAWKRYSELSVLDDELRRDFGWQMDALDDGKGVLFPSPRGLESWWYGVRNGGGMVTTLMGDGTGLAGEEGAIHEGTDGAATLTRSAGQAEENVGWGSSLYSLFRTSSGSGDTAKINGTAAPATNEKADSTNSHQNCPIPVSFIERRQKELSSYWTNLMRIEDIFEFGDVHSHKFGKAMATFLGVDEVLRSRNNESSLQSGATSATSVRNQLHPSTFPAIHEEDETAEALGTFRPSFASSAMSPAREISGLTGSGTAAREISGLTGIHDDDVSILTEGTGAFGDAAVSHNANGVSPLRGRPVVDVVPGHYSNGVDAAGGGAVNNAAPGATPKQARSTSSAASSAASGRRRRVRAAPRAKPAFQRQFLTP